AVLENTIEISYIDSSLPIKLFFPRNTSKKKPTTVGGNTSGRVKKPSTRPLNLFNFVVKYAIYTPNIKVIIVAIIAAFNDINKGE
ncbi:MAG TPA: hypothetical protein DCG60_00785, partial [Tissierella sp.]